MIKKHVAVTIAALVCSSAFAHGISPQRLTAPSGTPTVIAEFVASNNYKETDGFEVEIFKHDLDHPIEGMASPSSFKLLAKSSRRVKVKFDTPGDDVYIVCTKEMNDEVNPKSVLSRVCARIGVGVDPSPSKPGPVKSTRDRAK